jgi:aromatic ring-cleaving dioxygenase
LYSFQIVAYLRECFERGERLVPHSKVMSRVTSTSAEFGQDVAYLVDHKHIFESQCLSLPLADAGDELAMVSDLAKQYPVFRQTIIDATEAFLSQLLDDGKRTAIC